MSAQRLQVIMGTWSSCKIIAVGEYMMIRYLRPWKIVPHKVSQHKDASDTIICVDSQGSQRSLRTNFEKQPQIWSTLDQ